MKPIILEFIHPNPLTRPLLGPLVCFLEKNLKELGTSEVQFFYMVGNLQSLLNSGPAYRTWVTTLGCL